MGILTAFGLSIVLGIDALRQIPFGNFQIKTAITLVIGAMPLLVLRRYERLNYIMFMFLISGVTGLLWLASNYFECLNQRPICDKSVTLHDTKMIVPIYACYIIFTTIAYYRLKLKKHTSEDISPDS